MSLVFPLVRPLASSLAGALTLSTGVSFDLAAFMAEQSDGFTFDFAAYDRQFQENTGPTPADEANEVIGLALEDRTWDGQTLAQVMAGQGELLLNGDFSGPLVGWSTSNASLAIVAQELQLTATGPGFPQGSYSFATTPGRAYRFRAKVRKGSGANAAMIAVNNVGANLSGPAASTTSTVGEYVERTFQANSAVSRVIPHINSANASVGDTAFFDDISVKEVPSHYALQASSNFKPKVQATGAKFDGSDDFQITDYSLSGATEVFAFDWVDIPAEIAATQIMFGGQNAGGEAFYLAVLTDGALRLKIGSTSIDSTGVDIRGGQHVVGAYTNGTTAYLMVDAVVVGSDTYSGSLPATAWYLGAVNNNGSATAFFGGSLLVPHTGREAITEARARQISTALAA